MYPMDIMCNELGIFLNYNDLNLCSVNSKNNY